MAISPCDDEMRKAECKARSMKERLYQNQLILTHTDTYFVYFGISLVETKKSSGRQLDDSKALAHALGFVATCESSSNDFTDSDRFVSSLSSLICGFDWNGNCIIESSAVQSGSCIKEAVSHEVHVLDTVSIRNQFSPLSIEDKDAPVNQAEEEEKLEQANTANAVALNKYEALEQQIRCTPSVAATVPSEPEVLSHVEACDLAALKIYQAEIRGSIAAGFQLAVRLSGVIIVLKAQRLLFIVPMKVMAR